MDRRIVAINNWVTARYFKKSDVDTFFRNLEFFIKKGVEVHPNISVSKPIKSRRTADVILSSGVIESEAREKIGAEKLLLQYSWNEHYELCKVVDEKAVIAAMESKDGASVLFEKISDYVREVTDSDVEMRGIK
ncbi:MAG: hypothetical protein MR436_16805 [Eubacterium sp.]|nr:hypothetical protein [Eubacterium sp.]